MKLKLSYSYAPCIPSEPIRQLRTLSLVRSSNETPERQWLLVFCRARLRQRTFASITPFLVQRDGVIPPLNVNLYSVQMWPLLGNL